MLAILLDLPSHRALAEEITDHLLDGDVVVLLGQPSSGRTSVVQLVRELASAVCWVSQTIDPEIESEEAVASVAAAVAEAENSGLGIIVVDDLGKLLRTAAGGSLQSRLTAAAVDGPRARDIGVLLTATYADALSRTGLRGSPVADAAQRYVAMPLLSGDEVVSTLVAAGETSDKAASLVETYGSHLLLIELARRYGGSLGEVQVREATLGAVAGLHAGGASRVLDLARRQERGLPTAAIDAELPPLVWKSETGRSRLSLALVAGGIADLLPGSVATWPSDPATSVLRFRARTYGAREALWFDRYFGSGLIDFIHFIDRLAQMSGPLQLDLLGSNNGIDGLPERIKARFRERMHSWRSRGLCIEWRLIDGRDYADFHDRQLVFPHRIDGYHLPPCDRITGRTAVGNENDAYLPRAPVAAITTAWQRARRYL